MEHKRFYFINSVLIKSTQIVQIILLELIGARQRLISFKKSYKGKS